jgi:hypothetical protein
MVIPRFRLSLASMFSVGLGLSLMCGPVSAQVSQPAPVPVPDEAGPQTDAGPIIIKKKKDVPDEAPAARRSRK